MAPTPRTNPSAVVVSIASWTTNDANGNAVFVYRDSRWRAPTIRS
jgi:hypothetical protein